MTLDTRPPLAFEARTWPWFPVVMLHRVTDVTPEPNPYDLCRSQAELAGIIYELRREGRRIVTLGEAVAVHDAGRDVSRLACLTFDDGYRDFLTHAWPVLRRNDAPATVFVVTDRIGDWNTWDYGAEDLTQQPLMTRDEILKLAGEGVEFGSHSATHPRLSSLAPADREPEIAGSKRALEELLQKDVSLFCYPHIDQDDDAQRQVAAAGYVAAVGGEQTQHTRFLMHRLELSRVDKVSMRLRFGGWRYRAKRSPALYAVRLVKTALRPKIRV